MQIGRLMSFIPKPVPTAIMVAFAVAWTHGHHPPIDNHALNLYAMAVTHNIWIYFASGSISSQFSSFSPAFWHFVITFPLKLLVILTTAEN